MKIHSMEGLKRDAPRTTCTVVCGETGAAQGMRGITVVVESTAITCLYNAATDDYLWIADGQFVHEDDVRAFLDEGRPPAIPEPVNVSDELAKFAAYRAECLPVLAARVQADGPQKYGALTKLSGQWAELYVGYVALLEVTERTATQGRGAVPLHVLVDKQDTAESALLDIASKFMTEYARLKLN